MIQALVVAVVAVALGLALGLAPLAGQKALGPLRTLAVAAVIGVAVLHLLPESFSTLGPLGLLVFTLGLSLPRLIGNLRAAPGRHDLGWELGYWGLLAHHVGDGLALGAYATVDDQTGQSHLDVLLALVLHTVPLVAVVSTNLAKLHGRKVAVLRAVGLMAATVVGVLLARLVPPEWVERAQAWIAAAVAGLLLHGLSHDLTEDLPRDPLGRSMDLLLAGLGLAIGWIGSTLDEHSTPSVASSIGSALFHAALGAALPLLVGLLLATALLLISQRLRGSRTLRATDPEEGARLGPEVFLLNLVHFGWVFSAGSFALNWLATVLGGSGPKRPRAPEAPFAPVPGFINRFDQLTVWAFAGIAASAALQAVLVPDGYGQSHPWTVLGVALFFSLALPIHGVLAPIAVSALLGKGLGVGAAFFLCIAGPLFLKSRPDLRSLGIAGLAAALSLPLGRVWSPPSSMVVGAPSLSALTLLVGFLLVRIYHLGFRGWLAPLRRGSDASERVA